MRADESSGFVIDMHPVSDNLVEHGMETAVLRHGILVGSVLDERITVQLYLHKGIR